MQNAASQSAAPHPGPRRRLAPRGLCAAAAALASLAVSGCQSIDLSGTSVAQLRIVQASAEAGALDAYQNATGLAYNLGFGGSTSYVAMAPGGYALSVARAGTRQTLGTANEPLLADHAYTEIIGGSLAAMHQTLYTDDMQPAPAGEIKLRILQEATRVGAVDVYLVPASGRLASASLLAANLNPATSTGYLTLPAGTYALDVVAAGSMPQGAPLFYSGAQVAYASGAVRTVVLIETPGAAVGGAPSTQHAGVQAITLNDADTGS